VCKEKPSGLNQLAGHAKEFELLETGTVGRDGFAYAPVKYKPLGIRLLTEPVQDHK